MNHDLTAGGKGKADGLSLRDDADLERVGVGRVREFSTPSQGKGGETESAVGCGLLRSWMRRC